MRYLFVLTLIVGIWALSLTLVFERTQHESDLFISTPYVLHLSRLDNLAKQKYLPSDELGLEDFENLSMSFLIAVAGSLIILFNYWHREILCDEIKALSYHLFLASLPLRSPPVFS